MKSIQFQLADLDSDGDDDLIFTTPNGESWMGEKRRI